MWILWWRRTWRSDEAGGGDRVVFVADSVVTYIVVEYVFVVGDDGCYFLFVSLSVLLVVLFLLMLLFSTSFMFVAVLMMMMLLLVLEMFLVLFSS